MPPKPKPGNWSAISTRPIRCPPCFPTSTTAASPRRSCARRRTWRAPGRKPASSPPRPPAPTWSSALTRTCVTATSANAPTASGWISSRRSRARSSWGSSAAGLDLNLTDAASLSIAYQGQFGSGVQQNGFNAKLNVKF
ncbi:autotransporter outer membrane beta-barrel domain-containing protein [Mesorhizobium sp. M7A.F.Ca.US.008.03.1.1]|nr:autotransporter outer membrane beta-barrel domain-containing protein [Mesorhizobium sp. M7A.F.Ca.US.008.03.1.1]